MFERTHNGRVTVRTYLVHLRLEAHVDNARSLTDLLYGAILFVNSVVLLNGSFDSFLGSLSNFNNKKEQTVNHPRSYLHFHRAH